MLPWKSAMPEGRYAGEIQRNGGCHPNHSNKSTRCAANPTLTAMLADELAMMTSEFTRPAPPTLRRIDDFGIPNKAKEAASAAAKPAE